MNELINYITDKIFIGLALLAIIFFGLWLHAVLSDRKIKKNKAELKQKATVNKSVISDAEEFDKLINDQEFMSALEDEV